MQYAVQCNQRYRPKDKMYLADLKYFTNWTTDPMKIRSMTEGEARDYASSLKYNDPTVVTLQAAKFILLTQ
jgi:hypothetical protein